MELSISSAGFLPARRGSSGGDRDPSRGPGAMLISPMNCLSTDASEPMSTTSCAGRSELISGGTSVSDSTAPPSAMSHSAGSPTPPASGPAAMDPVAVVRSKQYLSALLLAAIIGVPISVAAYGFLALVSKIQELLFDDLPDGLFDSGVPAWWPLPWVALCGLLVGATIRYLPGNGGHSPALGFQTGGLPVDRELPGVIIASLTTLSLGVVLGPEAPLIAIGGGLAVLAVQLVKKDAPPIALTMIASA